MRLLLFVLLIGLLSQGCSSETKGCTDASAENYNPDATISDGSCTYKGCTDPDADNYNPNATISGDCIYKGCTDKHSDQYNASANTDDGSCKTYFDRWTATYTGDFKCTGTILNQYFGEATMTFSKADIPDNMDSVKVDMTFSLSDIPFTFNAQITRDSLFADAFFPNFQSDVDIIPSIEGEVLDITLNGALGISDDNTSVDGTLNVTIVEKTLGFTYNDSCTYEGKKQ